MSKADALAAQLRRANAALDGVEAELVELTEESRHRLAMGLEVTLDGVLDELELILAGLARS